MEYQQLPPVSSMNIAVPIASPSPHLQVLQNSTTNSNSNSNSNSSSNSNTLILSSMQPPTLPGGMPIQVNGLAHIVSNSSSNNNNNNNMNSNNNQTIQNNHQSLPPPTQLLQIHHLNSSNNNSNNNAIINGEEGNNRWTQYQVQQLWRHHAYFNGKSGNSKDICGEDKHKEDGDPWSVDAPAAFLGPNLWDRTLPYDTDLKVHPNKIRAVRPSLSIGLNGLQLRRAIDLTAHKNQYVDLDEFLSENCMPSVDGLPSSHLGHSTGLGHRSDSLGHSAGLSLGLGQVTKRERSPSPSDCMSPDTMNPPSPADSMFSMASTGREFDPRTRAFSDEELKPQPMIKKSRKQFVPDELKDDKYWARRRKNNMAAKRSRDARRMKENQIALRAGFLEKENMSLHRELEQLKQENMELRARLSKYQEV